MNGIELLLRLVFFTRLRRRCYSIQKKYISWLYYHELAKGLIRSPKMR
jgi:hypothetical protein